MKCYTYVNPHMCKIRLQSGYKENNEKYCGLLAEVQTDQKTNIHQVEVAAKAHRNRGHTLTNISLFYRVFFHQTVSFRDGFGIG